MKAYVGVDVWIHTVLTSTLVGGEWSASRTCHFTPGERVPSTYWIGGRVDPRASLDEVEKRKFLTLPGLKLRPLGRPARSQSLYRLSYPGSQVQLVICITDLSPHSGDHLADRQVKHSRAHDQFGASLPFPNSKTSISSPPNTDENCIIKGETDVHHNNMNGENHGNLYYSLKQRIKPPSKHSHHGILYQALIYICYV
jgi:hypothetical protein